MDDISKLQALIDHYANGSRPAFASLIGLPAATLTTWFFRKSITAKGREAILDTFPELNREWLLRDDPHMLVPEPDTVAVPRDEAIPFYGDLNGTCGALELPFAPEYATDYVHIPGLRSGQAVIPAEGDSMFPTIQHGDSVVVGDEVRLADTRANTIYLICTREGHRMFKRIEHTAPTSRSVMAISDNPDYSPRAVVIDKRDILHVFPALNIIRRL